MTGQGKQAIDLALAESFKELASRHPIEKITIKDITDKAGVIRPTFYNHFQDKYELIEWIVMEQIIRPAAPLIENGMFNEAVVLMFTSYECSKVRRTEFIAEHCRGLCKTDTTCNYGEKGT